MAQKYSIVETFDNMSDFTWHDEWLVIADIPGRKGKLDYEQESFRLSYNSYLKDIAMRRESVEAGILVNTMHGMLHASPDADGYYDMLPLCDTWLVTHKIPGSIVYKTVYHGSMQDAIDAFNKDYRHSVMVNIQPWQDSPDKVVESKSDDPFGDPRTLEEIEQEIATYQPGYVWKNPFEHDGTPDCQCGDCYKKKDPWFHPQYDSLSDCSEY